MTCLNIEGCFREDIVGATVGLEQKRERTIKTGGAYFQARGIAHIDGASAAIDGLEKVKDLLPACANCPYK